MNLPKDYAKNIQYVEKAGVTCKCDGEERREKSRIWHEGGKICG